jgi:hypothetical protein
MPDDVGRMKSQIPFLATDEWDKHGWKISIFRNLNPSYSLGPSLTNYSGVSV